VRAALTKIELLAKREKFQCKAVPSFLRVRHEIGTVAIYGTSVPRTGVIAERFAERDR
jgi:hypothetical protein